MRLTVYRVEVALYHGDSLKATWREHSFAPSDEVNLVHPDRVNVVWSRSRPIEVDTPPLCRLAEVDLPAHGEKVPAVPPARHRLVTPFDACGWDATSVVYAAECGSRGFRLATEPTCQTVREIYTDVCTPSAPEPTATIRWGIAFASRQLPHHRSFLASSSLTPTGPLASTLDLSQAASWDAPGAADGWLRGAGLDPDRPLDGPGRNWLYPAVAELPAGKQLPVGAIAFEFPRASSPSATPPWESAGELRPDPAAATVMCKMSKLHRRPRASAQTLFAFSDSED